MERYYLEHVTSLGESHGVYASEDIKNAHGVNLIAKGMRINQRFLDLLMEHKLLKSIDNCLEITGVLNASKLKSLAITAFEELSDLRLLFEHLSNFTDLAAYINCMLLNKILLNKLSVMQYRLPKQFEHSLRVSLICLFIGRICGVSEPEMQQLAIIGLLHDLGVLHIDPVLLNDDRELNASEWRQMYAHPVIGFLILQKQAELPANIARAVLEHHERIDGSGYPKHLTDSQISKLGRIVALAEIILGVCQKNSCEHLVTILKVNIDKLDKGIVEQMCHAFYGHQPIDQSQTDALLQVTKEEMLVAVEIAKAINAVFSCWQETYEKLEEKDSIRLNSRIEAICHGLKKAGLSPLDAENTIRQYDMDLSAFREAKTLLIEVSYQLKNLLRLELQRHTDENCLPEQLQFWFSFSERQFAAIDDLLH